MAVIDGNPTIKTTIPRPALGDFDRRYAFFKIMSKHDLALYTLVCCREDIRIVVYEGNLRAFTLSLSDLVLDKRCEERVENMECDLVVSKKAQHEEEKVQELPKKANFQTKLEDYSISCSSPPVKSAAPAEAPESPEQIVSNTVLKPRADDQIVKPFHLTEEENK